MFRLVGASLKAQGIFPTEENILTTGDLTCTVEDKLTGMTTHQFEGVKTQEQASDITARGISSINTTFVAIRLRDEFERPI